MENRNIAIFGILFFSTALILGAVFNHYYEKGSNAQEIENIKLKLAQNNQTITQFQETISKLRQEGTTSKEIIDSLEEYVNYLFKQNLELKTSVKNIEEKSALIISTGSGHY